LLQKIAILSLDKILNIIPKLKPVEGRFEKIGKIKNQSKVILDYAHTPDALKTCLLNLREQFPNKKIQYYLVVEEIEIKIKDQKWAK
jgi:murE/murF fusion protein